MSEILLGQSYYLRFDPKLWDEMRPYPPLGSMYAAACLQARGHDVALFDAMLAGSETEWAAALDRHRPRYAVLFEDNFNYLSKMCLLRMREAAFAMIAAARARGCTVLVCGSDASDHAARYLSAGADYVLMGEGEATLVELMALLAGPDADSRPAGIRGLAYRDEGAPGGVAYTTPRPVLRELDALPRPAWDLVDVDRYREIWLRRHGYFSMNAVTTRGCPYHCNWCAKPIWGQRYNVRSPGAVANELAWLKETYSPDHIWFADDIMGLKPGWLADFAAAVEARDARVPFKCLSRVDLLLREGDIAALRRAGCETVWVGAESGSQKILDAMEKGTRVEQIREAASRLRAEGIRVGFFLQFGYPGEDRADIRATFRLVRECMPDDIGVSVSYPLPGTKFYDRVEAQLGTKRNWSDSADLAMLFRGAYGTTYYRQLHAALHAEFRVRTGLRELARLARRPWRADRRALRRAAGTAYHAVRLPAAHWRLRRLEHAAAADAPAPLRPELDQTSAASPSPQPPTSPQREPHPPATDTASQPGEGARHGVA